MNELERAILSMTRVDTVSAVLHQNAFVKKSVSSDIYQAIDRIPSSGMTIRYYVPY